MTRETMIEKAIARLNNLGSVNGYDRGKVEQVINDGNIPNGYVLQKIDNQEAIVENGKIVVYIGGEKTNREKELTGQTKDEALILYAVFMGRPAGSLGVMYESKKNKKEAIYGEAQQS